MLASAIKTAFRKTKKCLQCRSHKTHLHPELYASHAGNKSRDGCPVWMHSHTHTRTQTQWPLATTHGTRNSHHYSRWNWTSALIVYALRLGVACAASRGTHIRRRDHHEMGTAGVMVQERYKKETNNTRHTEKSNYMNLSPFVDDIGSGPRHGHFIMHSRRCRRCWSLGLLFPYVPSNCSLWDDYRLQA